jgi:2-methylisocitrate lyase-like PEP mutase family enzyme
MGSRFGQAARVARLQGSGHHKLRLRGLPGPQRRQRHHAVEFAAERVAAAAEAAHAGPVSFVLTARAENYLHGRPDLADTIARLQAFAEAGADVLYAPGLRDIGDIRRVVREVDRPCPFTGWYELASAQGG